MTSKSNSRDSQPEEVKPKNTNTEEANPTPNHIQPTETKDIEKMNKGGYGLRPGVKISGDQ